MKNNTVSVIVPVYNTGKYLSKCVESLIKQSLKNIEIILVDDGSTDGSSLLCDKYKLIDERIIVIHKKNQGLGYARNTGLNAASGEYITFVDSDDYLDIDSLEKLYCMAVSNQLDICYGSFCFEKLNGSSFRKYEVKNITVFEEKKDINQFLLNMIGPLPDYKRDVKYAVSVCKAIFRLNLIKENNYHFNNERNIASEDLLFHLKIFPSVKKVGLLPICYYHYCERENSITKTFSEDKFRCIESCIKYVKTTLSSYFSTNEYMIHYQRFLFLSLRGVLSKEFERSDINFFKKLFMISLRCSNNSYKDLFDNYPYHKLPFAKAFLYICMKKKYSFLIYLIMFLKKIVHK